VLRKFFFFSSRRRHTRFSRDWSSDVCSSDLHNAVRALACNDDAAWLGTYDGLTLFEYGASPFEPAGDTWTIYRSNRQTIGQTVRSEERRVGKEWTSRRWAAE